MLTTEEQLMVERPWEMMPSLSGLFPSSSAAHEADTGQRLLNLVPLPTWECNCRSKYAHRWEAVCGGVAGGRLFGLLHCTLCHQRSRTGHGKSARCWLQADRTRPALPVGFVGATSVGKSWLVGRLQSEGAIQPEILEKMYTGGLQSADHCRLNPQAGGGIQGKEVPGGRLSEGGRALGSIGPWKFQHIWAEGNA
ncbi:unnamed protein product [Polarella glacialis]|uniref:Uncharacterized protein n=1 Tax=Polarella glacialis TaxID=89957 RepID=A0A813M246_POLGL|nr:unnamed protein product [Polarella glacialis]